MNLILRPYQQEAYQAIYDHLRRRDDNPCVVLPTGSGKTPLLAYLCRKTVEDWHGRILVLSHVKELLEQAANHLASFLPVNMVGLHSAGLGRRDTDHPVLVAGIQSVYDKAGDLGRFDIIIVDEAHLIPESGEGRYLTFLRDARIVSDNRVKVVGLTATPFRLGSGLLCKPENILNHVCYEANVKELIVQGWLCPLRTRRGIESADMARVRIMGTGEFAKDEEQAAFEAVIKPACEEILTLTGNRHSVLVFAAGVNHARLVADALGGEMVTGETDKRERARIIDDFRRGAIKYLVNVDVLTTGFDAPNVDCVVLLRATMSPGLYCQMLGRGLRKHDGKEDCLVLDYGDNALRHGPIDRIQVFEKGKRKGEEERPGKECPNCHEVVAVQYRICPNCEYEFPFDPTPRHSSRAGDAPVLSGEAETAERTVYEVTYHENVKEKEGGTSVTLRVEYVLNEYMHEVAKEWLCFNHPANSKGRRIAEQWWKLRSNAPVPATVMDALALIRKGALADVNAITLRREPGEQYSKIVGYDLADIPYWDDAGSDDEEFFDQTPLAELVGAENIPF